MWCRGGVLVGALVWAGCGGVSEPARPISEEPVAVPGVPTPPPPTPEVPAEQPPAVVQLCTRTEYRPDGVMAQWESRGADGLMREQRWFHTDGREIKRHVQQVEAGRVASREERDDFSWRRHTWHYGARGELVRSTYFVGQVSEEGETRYFYDAQGRADYEDHFWDGKPSSRRSYVYAEGRLTRVELRYPSRDDAPGYLFALTTFTHHPNGQVRREEYWQEAPQGYRVGRTQEWDAEGRLLVSELEGDEYGSRTEQAYDARGRLSRSTFTSLGSNSDETRVETFEYDDADRLVLRRLVWDWVQPLSGKEGHVRETWRSEFGAHGELVLQTVDLDEDGVADGRRTFTYDAAGRLVEERLEGRAPWNQPGRVVHTYGCQDAADGA